MYLSRIEMPWQHARDLYDVHRRLWNLFPGISREPRQRHDEERRGFLFRFEEQRPRRPVRILVQSRQAPVPASVLCILSSKELHPRPRAGQRLAFLLTANPVRTITDA
jgi:CRISPR system Cascade subunit CasE